MAQYLTSKDSGAPRIDPLEVSKPLSELYRKSVAKIEAILSNDRLQSEHHAIAIRLDNALLRLRHWEHDIRLAEGVLGVVEEDHPYLARADGFLLKDMLTRLSVLYNLLLVEYGYADISLPAYVAHCSMLTDIKARPRHGPREHCRCGVRRLDSHVSDRTLHVGSRSAKRNRHCYEAPSKIEGGGAFSE